MVLVTDPLSLGFAAALAVGFVLRYRQRCARRGLGMPPFVATLGTLGIAQGLSLLVTDGQSVVGIGARCRRSTNRSAGVPFSIVVALLAYLASRAALPHALRRLRVRDRRQSRGLRSLAPARGSIRRLRARRIDGGRRRAAADGPHECGSSDRRDRHGVRRHRRGDRRRHVVRARQWLAARHAARRRRARRAQERPQSARGAVLAAGRQHRRPRDRRAAHRRLRSER